MSSMEVPQSGSSVSGAPGLHHSRSPGAVWTMNVGSTRISGSSRPDVSDVIRHACDGEPIEADTLELIAHMTLGCPDTVSDLVLTLQENGLFTRRFGSLTWDGVLTREGRIHERVLAETASLDASGQDVLALLGVLGEASWAVMSSCFPPVVLDALLDAGLLERAESFGVQVCRAARSIHAAVFMSRLLPTDRAHLLGRVVRASLQHLEDVRGVDFRKLPAWALESGVQLPMALLSRLMEAPEADETFLADPALWLLVMRHPDVRPRDFVRAKLGSAQHRRLSGDLLAASSELDEAAEILATMDVHEEPWGRVQLALARFSGVVDSGGNRAEAVLHLDMELGRLGLKPAFLEDVAAMRALRLVEAGAWDDARPTLSEIADRPAHDRRHSRLQHIQAMSSALRGQASGGLTILRRMRMQAGAPWHNAMDHLQHEAFEGVILMLQGRPNAARTRMSDLADQLMHTPHLVREPASVMMSVLESFEGNWERATYWAQRAVSTLSRSDGLGFRTLALASLACGLAGQGRHAHAREALLQCAAEQRTNQMAEPFVQMQRARALAIMGDPSLPDMADAVLSGVQQRGLWLLEPFWLMMVVTADPRRLDDAALRRAREVETTVGGTLAPAVVSYMQSGLEGRREERIEQLRRLSRMGIRVPPNADQAVLTIREREVAEMAALGYGTKRIAARLHLSPRTVDAHLRRIFEKLGVTRDDLALLLY